MTNCFGKVSFSIPLKRRCQSIVAEYCDIDRVIDVGHTGSRSVESENR